MSSGTVAAVAAVAAAAAAAVVAAAVAAVAAAVAAAAAAGGAMASAAASGGGCQQNSAASNSKPTPLSAPQLTATTSSRDRKACSLRNESCPPCSDCSTRGSEKSGARSRLTVATTLSAVCRSSGRPRTVCAPSTATATSEGVHAKSAPSTARSHTSRIMTATWQMHVH